MSSDPVPRSSAVLDPHRGPGLLALLTTRRFTPLVWSLCLGAFNDALLVTTLAVLPVSSAAGPVPMAFALVAALAPAIVLSATAGPLVDKFDGATLARLAKLIELLAMALGAYGLLAPNPGAQLGALALLGLRFALGDPLKGAIAAQLLGADEVVGALALIEAASAAALAAGFVAAARLAIPGTHWVAGAGLLVALAGLVASRRIGSCPPPLPRPRVGLARRQPGLVPALLSLAWCWFCGAQLVAALAAHGPLASPGDRRALLPAIVCCVGVAAGALVCARHSGKQVDAGVQPFAAMALALLVLDLSFVLAGATPSGTAPFWRMTFDLAALGLFFGIFAVAAKALIQEHSTEPERGRVASLATLCKVVALLAGALLALGSPLQLTSIPWLLAGSAAGFAALAALAYAQDPHRALRFLTELLIHSFYRVGKRGFEHIPATGAAVLVCNHVSFVDSVVIMAAIRRPIRFVIDHRIYETPVANTLFRHSRTIPIATAKESPEQKEAAFAEVARALRNGELIGLFPEGGITRTGELNHFRYGVGRIVDETPVPVIPMALRGLWGSFYSRRYGPAMSKPSLLRFLARIELVAGPAVPAQDVTPELLQRLVAELRGDRL